MVPFQWIPFQYTHIYFFHNLVLCKEHFYPRFTLHHIQYPFNFFFFFSFSIKVLFFVQNIFTLLCPHRPPFYTIYLPSSYTKLFIFLNYGLVHFNLTDLIFTLTLMVHVLSDVLAPSILLPTIASVWHTSSDYCIRIWHTSSDYCIRIPYFFRLLHPYIPYFFRLLHPYMLHFFRLLHPHLHYCFRLIGNTETMSDYLFRTYITVSDVLHSHIQSGDRFRMYTTNSDVLACPYTHRSNSSACSILFPSY